MYISLHKANIRFYNLLGNISNPNIMIKIQNIEFMGRIQI